MKIVNLKCFRSLPNGTVFSKYEPCIFYGLRIKVDTWESDFLYQDLVGNIDADNSGIFPEKCELAEKGISIDLDFDCAERDGLFDEDRLFAIYEKKDIDDLIDRLQVSQSDLNK